MTQRPKRGPDSAADTRHARKRSSSLTRERVLDAAIHLVDQHGWRTLTMRRLGHELDVEAMALYRHVADRDDLLDGIVDRIVDTMDDDPQVLTTPEHGWQDFLERLAHGFRRVALTHPSIFPILVSRPPQAPWLRPPMRSLRWVEIFLDGLISEGFGDREAVAAYRTFTSFLLGYLLLEAAVHADEGQHEPTGGRDELASFPHLEHLQGELAKNESEREFAEGLAHIMERIRRS
ncbi:TetR/AcrR family transcriptional regulator C-terminal domain-containing protein [Janibacter sp. DB-40]|uniref:TetR/AcrR family transcriptional regulator n=1 Tax=Janibacter sp. DB-40 TaxID=3028808 RepID=UPI002405899D|nr:TetR/AcrR family transcriptional regulator C-terminal domain-containing protein [Janibacter sp. DB-40]